MSDDTEQPTPPAPPAPVVAYQLSITFIPSTGELVLDGPLNERHICYQMLGLAHERLLLIAMQLEIAAQKKRLVAPGRDN